ncbi:MAG TPA: hypothetical protein VK818_03170 [Methylomirabilota bacterium]|nr:hypothetical protein [Methylomirabilota bacterium]
MKRSIGFLTFLILACTAKRLSAQEPSPAETAHYGRAVRSQSSKTTILPIEHRFWGKENDLLFAGVAAARTLDYFSTLNMRRRGRQEIFLTNDAVDNHAGFAFIEVGATGVSIGASYIFHRYGHHKLERWTSIVHIGLATTGAARNYSLKTAHRGIVVTQP